MWPNKSNATETRNLPFGSFVTSKLSMYFTFGISSATFYVAAYKRQLGLALEGGWFIRLRGACLLYPSDFAGLRRGNPHDTRKDDIPAAVINLAKMRKPLNIRVFITAWSEINHLLVDDSILYAASVRFARMPAPRYFFEATYSQNFLQPVLCFNFCIQ